MLGFVHSLLQSCWRKRYATTSHMPAAMRMEQHFVDMSARLAVAGLFGFGIRPERVM
jgi:hypothetical protein